MAISLEAIAAVPLFLSLLLQPVGLAPEIGIETLDLARGEAVTLERTINPEELYRFCRYPETRLGSVEASAQIALEAVTLARDVWQPLSALLKS